MTSDSVKLAKTQPGVGYYPSVDILRGFAALSVVVYHLIVHFNWATFPIEGWWIWFRIGWMGVDLFFVISGFVIGLSAFAQIDAQGTRRFWRPFMRRRLARIVPLYYLTALLFVALVVPQLLFDDFVPNALAHLVFLHNLFPRFHGSIDGSNWSLGTEMQFYLLMVVAAPWMLRAGSVRVFFILVLIAWAWRYGATLVVPVRGDVGATQLFMLSTQLPGTLDEFGVGLVIAKLVRTQRGAGLLTKSPVWSMALATGLVWAVLALFWRYTYWDIPAMVVFYRTLLVVAFGAVLVCACSLNAVWWLRLTWPLRYLGTISYGIYLWHLPVMLTLHELPWLGPQRALPLVLILTLCLASVSWHFFEQPLMQRFSKRPS